MKVRIMEKLIMNVDLIVGLRMRGNGQIRNEGGFVVRLGMSGEVAGLGIEIMGYLGMTVNILR